MRTTSAPEGRALADAARVLAARRALAHVLDRLADAPLDPAAVGALRDWLDESYPPAAAALDRLRASGATAPPRRSPAPCRRGLAVVPDPPRRPARRPR